MIGIRKTPSYLIPAVVATSFFAALLVIPVAFNYTKRVWDEITYRRNVRLYNSAIADDKAGRSEEAIRKYTALIDRGFDHSEVYCARAQCRRDDTNALKDINQAIKIEYLNPVYRSVRASILLQLKEYDAALADCDFVEQHIHRGSIRTERDGLSLRSAIQVRAIALGHLGHYEAAVKVYGYLIEWFPADEVNYASRAAVLCWMGKYTEALGDYERAYELETADKSIEYAQPWLQTSQLADFLSTCPDARYRDGQRALSLATSACERSAYKDADALFALAAAKAETGQFENAIQCQENGLKLQGKSATKEEHERLECYRRHIPFRAAPKQSEEPEPRL